MEKERRKFSQEQYDMLKCCSDAKDMTKWNNWRKDKEIHLEGARLECFHLEGADLQFTHLEWAKLGRANLKEARLYKANLEGADLILADMKKAHIWNANLKGAKLDGAHLEGATFVDVHLEGAQFMEAHLEGAILKNCHLQNTNFRRAIVNGETLVWTCEVDKHITNENNGTDFSGIELNRIRIDPDTKQLLEYNIRRMNWEGWYMKNLILQWPVRLFWLISDYGISTCRIIGAFFYTSIVFALIYYCLVAFTLSSIVSHLSDGIKGRYCLLMVRSIYFSIVTMTTLGFGDMYAETQGFTGHILLTIQVLLGYGFLGALITRFAILFTGSGPAGEFTPMDEETKKLLEDMKGKKSKS